MAPALLDSSVYISALRGGDDSLTRVRRIAANSPLWLSAVVLEELYAGVSDDDRHIVQRLEHDFDKVHRILTPNLTDWVNTGRLLAKLATKYGYEPVGRGRLTNDGLIAMSAGRLGITVITANERDFRLIADFRSFDWQVWP